MNILPIIRSFINNQLVVLQSNGKELVLDIVAYPTEFKNGEMAFQVNIPQIGQRGTVTLKMQMTNLNWTKPGVRLAYYVGKEPETDVQTISIPYDRTDFKPFIVDQSEDTTYAVILERLGHCSICGRPIANKRDLEYIQRWYGKQMKLLGAVPFGMETPGKEGEMVCMECRRQGRVTFKCVLCGEERPATLLKEEHSRGCLCQVCYESKSAKEWEETVDRLLDEGRYDDL